MYIRSPLPLVLLFELICVCLSTSQQGKLKLLDAIGELNYVKYLNQIREQSLLKEPLMSVQQLDNNIPIDSQTFPRDSNTDAQYNTRDSLYDNDIKADSKRGWEDLALSWRRINSKRALEVVNRLWSSPEIRRQYIHYLRKGKRSKEVMENIPVQSDNEEPTWMVDEVGYYPVDYPQTLNAGLGEPGHVEQGNMDIVNKRGWEDIAHLLGGKRYSHFGKRAWEDIHWKRTLNDADKQPISPSVLNNLLRRYLQESKVKDDTENTDSEISSTRLQTQDTSDWWQNILDTDM